MKLPALLPNPPEPVQRWGEVLHRLAEASGCRTQRELAEQLHVVPATMNRYLTCERLPDDKLVSTLVDLAQANGSVLDSMSVQHAYNKAVKAFETWQPRHRNVQVAPPAPTDDQKSGVTPEQRVDDVHQTDDWSATTTRPMSTALANCWTWFKRLHARHRTVAVGVAALAIAAVVVLVTRPWETSNVPNSADPLPLRRYQAPTPDRANFISPTEPGPSGWTAMPSLGEVYAPSENRVSGLVPIYRFRCTNCGEALVYFLSRDNSRRSGFEFEAEAFRCFDPNDPPPRTRPLQSLWNEHRARMWAVRGTNEYHEATANGFKDPSPDALPLCYIW